MFDVEFLVKPKYFGSRVSQDTIKLNTRGAAATLSLGQPRHDRYSKKRLER
jgi:hypothetical protein